ncbi:hypothetical protein QF034_006025 [Streptomyces africanus]|uniref:Uncharacterized protein n=1 Tax=Streptomyces africanus TaxID=231024 RepID=A0ABU0QWL6_9ACTN|nr:hypothetical protein [Streptomyces africanus]
MAAPTAAPTRNGTRFGMLRTIRFVIRCRSSRFMRLFSAVLSVDGLVASIPRSPDQASRYAVLRCLRLPGGRTP